MGLAISIWIVREGSFEKVACEEVKHEKPGEQCFSALFAHRLNVHMYEIGEIRQGFHSEGLGDCSCHLLL